MMRCIGSRRASKKTRIAQERDDVQREQFREEVSRVPVEALVFLDECGFGSNMRREYGRAIGGARCVEVVPKERGQNRSVVGALSLPSASNPAGLWSLWQREGAWTGKLSPLFVEEELLPRLPSGSVLVLDNARTHHGVALREAVEAAGHRLLFLPPYSPDFNPRPGAPGWCGVGSRIGCAL